MKWKRLLYSTWKAGDFTIAKRVGRFGSMVWRLSRNGSFVSEHTLLKDAKEEAERLSK